MAEMSKELMDLVNSVPLCYLATASKEGVPNVDPVGSAIAMSPDTIVIATRSLAKTIENLKENPKAALVVNSEPPPRGEVTMEKVALITGGQIKASGTVLTSGDMHEQAKSMTTKMLGPKIGERLTATVVLKVEEIYSITPGPDAGKRIA